MVAPLARTPFACDPLTAPTGPLSVTLPPGGVAVGRQGDNEAPQHDLCGAWLGAPLSGAAVIAFAASRHCEALRASRNVRRTG